MANMTKAAALAEFDKLVAKAQALKTEADKVPGLQADLAVAQTEASQLNDALLTGLANLRTAMGLPAA